MSTHIENEVVSMQFDNKHFESNVRTSLSTLEKLKQSLKLHDAAKGFENVNKAARGVDLSPLSGAVDKVGLKFNGLYTIADQVLRNIVNSVQHHAKTIVSAFTIDPVKTGFQEYETQLNSVQTILANTQSKGETLETVNAALDELNLYADKTIYNFTEMTRNIGTFTAAGVGLNESVQAIKGIANLAAVSGSTSQQASTAMYQLSQALATGTVRLQDWNSVVNAGMGGELFQNALKRTAEHMGTNVDALIEKYGSFRDSLTQGEWLTTEVLTETLAQLSGAYTEADLIAQGYTKKQAEEITQLAQTADEAATKVKTFTQLMDTLKESAQSGWSQTWRLIVGDYEESKTLWTSVSEVLGGIIEKSSESRNKLLSGALDNSGWDKMIESVDKAGIEVSDFEAEVKKLAKQNGIEIDAMVKEYGSLEKAVLALEDPAKLLKQAFDNLFSPKGKGDKNGNGLKEYLVKEGDTLSDLAEKWGTSVEEIMLLNKHIKDPNLILTGWTIEIPGAIEKTGEAAEDATGLVENFRKALDGVGKTSGRDLLIESFANLWSVIKNVAGSIGKAFRAVFEPLESEDIYNAINKFHDFTAKIAAVFAPLEDGKTLSAASENIRSTFKGVFSLVDILGKLIGGGLKIGWEVLSRVLGHFGIGLLEFTAAVGKAISKVNEWLEKGIDKGVTGLINGLKWLYNLPAVQKIITSFSDAWTKFKEGFSSRWNAGTSGFAKWIEYIKTFKGELNLGTIKHLLSKFRSYVIDAFFGTEDGGTIFDGLIESVKKFGSIVKTKSIAIWNGIKTWWDGLKKLDGFSLENIKKAFVDFYTNVIKPIFVREDGTTIFDSLISAIKNFWGSVKNWFGKIGINLEGIKNDILAFFGIEGEFNIGGAWTTITGKLSEIKDNLTSGLGGIIDFFVNNKGKIMSLAAIIGIFVLFKKFLDVAGLFGDAIQFLPSISDSFEKFTKSLSFSLKANAMKTIAEGIAILIGAIVALCLVPKDQMLPALGVLTAAVVLLGGLFTVMALVSNKIGTVDLTKFAVSMLAMSGSLLIFGMAAKTLAGIGWDDLGKAGVILGAFVILGGIIGKLASKSTAIGKDMAGFGTMIAKFGIALLLLAGAIHIFGNMDDEVLLKGIATVSVLLLELAGMMWATNLLAKTGKKQSIVKMGSIAMGLGSALLMIAGAVAIFGSMDGKSLLKGMLATSACIALMIGVVKATEKIPRVGKDGSILKVGAMFAGMGAALLMIAGAVAIFGNMNISTLLKGGAAVLVFMGMFAGMMKATNLLATTDGSKQFAKVSGMILAFSASLMLIAGAIVILSMIDFSDLVKSTAIIGAIGLLFVALIAATKFIPEKSVGTIIALSGALLLLAGSVALLSYIEADRLKLAGVVLGSLIGMMAVLTASLKGPAISPRKILSIAGLLAAVLTVVGAFVAVGVANLPTIGSQMSEFMKKLNTPDGFISGIEKLSSISSLNPGIIEDIGTMLAAVGTLLSGAAKYAIVDALPFVDASTSLDAMVDWIEDVADVLIDLGPKLSGASINREALTAVLDAVKILCECAALAPTTTIALGGFWSKWGSGIGAVIDIPALQHAKDWIVQVVPVVRDLALQVSGKGVTINKTNLDNVCTAATTLAEAAAKAPSATVAGGGFTSKWVSGGAAVVDWPMLNWAKDWIVKVAPIVKGLAESVSSGEAKNLDKTKLEAICTGAKTLAEAAALAPSLDVALGLAKGPWGFGAGTYVTVPLIGSVANWISAVKAPMVELAKACSSGVNGISDFNAENFKTVIQGVSDLCTAVKEAPSVDLGGLINVGKLGFTLAFGISHPILSALTSFITNVKDPIVGLANACSGGVDGIKNFNAETFKSIIGGIAELCTAVKESPTVDAGGLINAGKLGFTLALGVSHPMISAISTFITNVKDPIVALANACSGGADGIKDFDATTFETIIQAIADIAAIKFPSVTVGGGFAKFVGGIGLGFGFNHPQVNALSAFITSSKDAIIGLANAASGVGEGNVIANGFNKENFESIIGAIAQIGSIQFPQFEVGGGLAGFLGAVNGLGVGAGWSYADFDGVVDFITNVKEPIIKLANAVSGEGENSLNANFDKAAFESIVGAIAQLGSVQFPTVDTATAVIAGIAGFTPFAGGLSTESKNDFEGFVGFIRDVKQPIIDLATAVSGENVTVDHDKINSICTAIKDLATAAKDIPVNSWVGRTFTGVTDFTSFTTFISGVGPSIQTMNDTLKTVDFGDGSKIDIAAKAVKTLAQASAEIPETGGFWNWDGDTDWEGFKAALPAFGEGIAGFAKAISGIQATNLDSVSSSFLTVTQAISIINSSLGGGLSDAMIQRYNETLTALSSSITTFSNDVSGINIEATSTASKAILDLTGSIYNFMIGTDYTKVDVSTFKTKILEMGTAMSEFSTKISGINSEVVSTGTANIDGLISIINKVNTFSMNGQGWIQFPLAVDKVATEIGNFATKLATCNPSTAITNVNKLVSMLSSMNGVEFTGANSFPETLKKLAETSLKGFVDTFGGEDATTAVTDAISGLTSVGAGAAKSSTAYEDFYAAGKYCVEGLAAGIGDSDAVAKVISAAEAAVAAAIAAAEEEAGINSPAKEFIRIATYCGMGLIKGFANYESKTYESGRSLAESAKAGLSDAISKVRGIIENGVDAQPTIRPVLDLTDVSAGANRINSLFGTPSVGVLSRVGTISTMMNGIQNGRNNDVIAAINDLGSRLGNTSGNTYNINGITYDDGSNITSAVEALVRAAIRERRA